MKNWSPSAALCLSSFHPEAPCFRTTSISNHCNSSVKLRNTVRSTLRFLSYQSPASSTRSRSAPVPPQSTAPPPDSFPYPYLSLPLAAFCPVSLPLCPCEGLCLPCYCSALPPRSALLFRELSSASYKIYRSVLLTPGGLRKGARRIPAYSTGRRANPMLTHGEGPLCGLRGLHRPSTESTFTFTLGTFSSLQCDLLC